jgi:hydrogenase maturation protease
MAILLLGLGNPILGDDRIGWWVIQEVDQRIRATQREFVDLEVCSLGGITLMEKLTGYDKAIIVDAICTNDQQPGKIHRLTLDDLPSLYSDGPHDASLKDALEMGRRLELILPTQVVIVAVEINPQVEFSEQLSPPVEASISPAATAVLEELDKMITDQCC